MRTLSPGASAMLAVLENSSSSVSYTHLDVYKRQDMSPGYGYTGVVVAMLAGLHPLGVILASIFVAGMLVGADSMSPVSYTHLGRLF